MLRTLIRDERGHALLEGTMIIPLAIFVMAGIISFASMYLDLGTAQKSLREATRYLARLPSSQVCSWGLGKAQGIAVNGTTTVGWSAASITMDPPCPNPSTSVVHLHAEFTYTPLMFGALQLPTSFTVTLDHEEPYVGSY
jgi:Flp pilus assembly protein TadG